MKQYWGLNTYFITNRGSYVLLELMFHRAPYVHILKYLAMPIYSLCLYPGHFRPKGTVALYDALTIKLTLLFAKVQ